MCAPSVGASSAATRAGRVAAGPLVARSEKAGRIVARSGVGVKGKEPLDLVVGLRCGFSHVCQFDDAGNRRGCSFSVRHRTSVVKCPEEQESQFLRG